MIKIFADITMVGLRMGNEGGGITIKLLGCKETKEMADITKVGLSTDTSMRPLIFSPSILWGK